MTNYTGEELRTAAIRSYRLDWYWEFPRPRLFRRIQIPIAHEFTRQEQYFIPPASRWLFQYGNDSKRDGSGILSVFDMHNGVSVGFLELDHMNLQDLLGESLAPNKVVIALRFAR